MTEEIERSRIDDALLFLAHCVMFESGHVMIFRMWKITSLTYEQKTSGIPVMLAVRICLRFQVISRKRIWSI
eukprot:UN03499